MGLADQKGILRFIKVGANDGLSGDPCSDILIADSRWRGILIEPVPYLFIKLKDAYSDEVRFDLLQEAVGVSNQPTKFYYVNPKVLEDLPELPSWVEQLGSFDKQHILKHLGGILEGYILELDIVVQPLSSILKSRNVTSVDLLHIDTEGSDFNVIKSLDFSIVKPRVIFVEHKHLSFNEKRSLLWMLRIRGYSVFDCGSDYFAKRL